MKKAFFWIIIAIVLASGLYGIGEKTTGMGAASGWSGMETRRGVTEISELRPHPVLGLSSSPSPARDPSPDLYLSFDEGSPGRFTDAVRHYDLTASLGVKALGEAQARLGVGAAGFSAGNDPRLSAFSGENNGSSYFREEEPLVLRPRQEALFAPGTYLRDFSIAFWLCPANLDNGEEILSWSSSYPVSPTDYRLQRVLCAVSRNRLQWTFTNFFTDPRLDLLTKPESPGGTVTLTGSPILPEAWSHHLIRFDADYGLLEYLIDGRQEAIVYTTTSGREGGEVNTPVLGKDGSLALGGRYTGYLDEFRISGQCLENPVLGKFPAQGGRAESRTLDLGSPLARLLKLEAWGGRARGTGNLRNEYAGQRGFRFADHSEIRFYIRLSDNPYEWTDVPWIPVQAGAELPGIFLGRYVQIAAEFFPSGDGETTPYLEEIRLVYRGVESPPPPGQLMAFARDGAVELSWKPVADSNLGGYLVYYGTAQEVYFGEEGAPSSPLDAGNRTFLRIEGLKNGTLYYFSVASYDKVLKKPGEFSRETAARPQREFLVGQ